MDKLNFGCAIKRKYFHLGDHRHMFPHLTERIIMATANDLKTSQSGHVFDNRAVINAIDKTAILVSKFSQAIHSE